MCCTQEVRAEGVISHGTYLKRPGKETFTCVPDVFVPGSFDAFTVCTPFQIKPVFLLALTAQSGNVTLYLSILWYLHD